VGYGENHPVESNDTEEGRTRNRRVTLMILSSLPSTSSVLPDEVAPGNQDEIPGALPDAAASSIVLPETRADERQASVAGSV
jgi:chemotaxis protein MotB